MLIMITKRLERIEGYRRYANMVIRLKIKKRRI